jgi:hypothetical protein
MQERTGGSFAQKTLDDTAGGRLIMEDYLQQINDAQHFSFDETFDIYKYCATSLYADELSGRRLIINVLDNRQKFDSSLDEMLADLVESAGLYPYIVKEKLRLNSLGARIRNEFHHSDFLPDKYFHEDQKYLLSLLQTDKNVIVSAPTSYGKTLLLQEIIASNKYKNIVVIQPTLALLDETRKKLLNYRDKYKIIVRTSQTPSDLKGNLFLLTAERVTEYPTFPNIDFLMIDEFYKFSAKRDDERSDCLNNAFHLIINKFNCKFYLLGPNIDSISPGFEEKFHATFYNTKYNVVDCDSVNVYEDFEGQFGERGSKKAFKEQKLFELLFSLINEQTIIYCSSPQRVRYLSKKFYLYLVENKAEFDLSFSLTEWIQKYVSENWSLINLLNHGIGIHDGALQKHITTSIIDYFNNDRLRYLFCTTTIIEGVNTSAKNIVYFDKTIGTRTPIDFFDYSNIKGRAGRFMVHYKGRIFNFNPPPVNDKIVIDIPFFEQNPISDEVMINLEENEITNKNTNQYQKLHDIEETEKSLYRKNGLRIFGQKSIVEKLRANIKSDHELICWHSMPNYNQLKYVLSLAWDNLLKPGETTRPMTLPQLVKTTYDYVTNQNIEYLIKNRYQYLKGKPDYENVSDEDIIDDSIRTSFQILKHWFQYKVPKWLLVIHELQKFVCIEKGLSPGNYQHYASLIENEFVRENLTILTEYGIPISAIQKIEKHIAPDIKEDDVLDIIKKNQIFDFPEFLPYEKEKILENL